jgi:hypothetical protein
MSMPAIPPSAQAVVLRRKALHRHAAALFARTATSAAASTQASSLINSSSVSLGGGLGSFGLNDLPPLAPQVALAVPLAQMVSSVERMHFYIQYAGWNDRPLQTTLARLYAAVCPDLLAPSPSLALLSLRAQGDGATAAAGALAKQPYGMSAYLLPHPPDPVAAQAGSSASHEARAAAAAGVAAEVISVRLLPPTRVGFLSKFFGDDEPHGELLEGIVHALKVFRDSRSGFASGENFRGVTSGSTSSSDSSGSSGGGGGGSGSSGSSGGSGKAFVSIVLHVASPGAKCSHALAAAADEVIELSLHWLGTRAAVASAHLDILIFADSLSEPLSYFLQMGRLAPIQCLFWGNPVTSGKASVDYFISADRMELPHRTRDISDLPSGRTRSKELLTAASAIEATARGVGTSVVSSSIVSSNIVSSSSDSSSSDGSDSSDFGDSSGSSGSSGSSSDGRAGDVYSEQVVLLAGQGIWYRRPPLETAESEPQEHPLAFRRSLGLNDAWTVHMCAQSLFKLHPSFDYVLRDILLADANAHVVLTADRRARWTAAFQVHTLRERETVGEQNR